MKTSIRWFACLTPVLAVLAGCAADGPEGEETPPEASTSELTSWETCTAWTRVSGLCWTRECTSLERSCVSARAVHMVDRTELQTWGAACGGGHIRFSNPRVSQCWQGTRCDDQAGTCIP